MLDLHFDKVDIDNWLPLDLVPAAGIYVRVFQDLPGRLLNIGRNSQGFLYFQFQTKRGLEEYIGPPNGIIIMQTKCSRGWTKMV